MGPWKTKADNESVGAFCCIITSVLLFLALLPWPYGYYNFLRFAVFLLCCSAIYLVFPARWPVIALCLAAALLWNPYTPVELTRDTWFLLDLGAGIGFWKAGSWIMDEVSKKSRKRAES